MERVDHIMTMETILDQHSQLISDLDMLLNQFEAHQNAYQTLKDYYMSETFLEDMDLANQGQFDHISCGVLSEDAVYNLLTDQHELGLRLLELGTAIMRHH